MSLSDLAGVFTRPYRVPASMIVLFAIVPLYIFIPEFLAGRTTHILEIPLDLAIPLQPGWALVYGSLYLFLIVLPILLIREEAQVRSTVRAYLAVWLTAYVCFFVYPTIAPRPAVVSGSGFLAASLNFLYSADTPFNCFPSLHVAHSVVSALACRRFHRGVGRAALGAATLIALSTLFTKQHYVLDVASGALLGAVASFVFLRDRNVGAPLDAESRTAPWIAVALGCAIALGVALSWLAYGHGQAL